jgi:hypothetical protein
MARSRHNDSPPRQVDIHVPAASFLRSTLIMISGTMTDRQRPRSPATEVRARRAVICSHHLTLLVLVAMCITACSGKPLKIEREPELKEGFWEIRSQTVTTDRAANPGVKVTENNIKVCRNHAYDEWRRSISTNGYGCVTVSEGLQGHKYSSVLHCASPGLVTDTQETSAFQSNTSVHRVSHSSTATSLRTVEATKTIDESYEGICPAGIQLGDLVGEDGRVVINLWKHE